MPPWLIHFLGFDFGARYGHVVPYDVWSGFGSDLGEATILAAVAGAYHKHKCHGCWRVGRHVVDGSPWCNRHHQAARDTRERG